MKKNGWRKGKGDKKKWKIELRSKNHPNVSIYFRRVHIYSINKKKKRWIKYNNGTATHNDTAAIDVS